MVVCRFFQQGHCKFGASCRNEHPGAGNQSSYNNRFSALNNSGGGQSNNNRAPDAPPYAGLTEDTVQRDLTSDLPIWILSCYGPGRDAPEQLFGGSPREQSFEEMRLLYMMAEMNGNPQAALNNMQTLYQNAQQQIQHTLSNIPAAIRFIVDSGNKHPNRIDICKNASGGGGLTTNAFGAPAPQVANPFGAPAAAAAAAATPTTGAFGQTSMLGQKPNPFGAPAFGQPAQPAAPAFGQASAPGAPSSVFGAPTQPAAFGQSSALGGGGLGGKVFGQGASQPAFGQSGFAQAALTTQQPGLGFGQTATLGVNQNPFGAPQQPAAANPFGQPAANNNPFGAPSPAKNAFGAQVAPTAATSGPFGGAQPPQQPSAFAQPQPPTQQTSNPFGGAPAAANPFGQSAALAPTQSGALFGAPLVGSVAAALGTNSISQLATEAVKTAVSQQAQSPYGPNATRKHPDISEYSSRNPDGSLRMFKGKAVIYETPKGSDKPLPFVRQFDGSMMRIWMPNGAPPYTKETEADDPSVYEDPAVQQQWAGFLQTGEFEDGMMPEVPPKREWCSWDF
ncbi:nucleoporin AMO1 [Podospora fimiseda]|uniref:Nucleoporin AMO1 n=1 Tax=Podospora fimiseda TaxID=252190 RepID=A0AAN7BMU1_9PEZI|nr:nucleoporin AMO1 [Podospora fimiseda]